MTTSQYDSEFSQGNFSGNAYDSREQSQPRQPQDYQPPKNYAKDRATRRREAKNSRNDSVVTRKVAPNAVKKNPDGSLEIMVEPAKTIPLIFGKDTRPVMFTPPKTSAFMKMLEDDNGEAIDITKMQYKPVEGLEFVYEWYFQGLSEDDFNYLMSRIDSTSDYLDVTHLIQMQENIMESAGGENPTT